MRKINKITTNFVNALSVNAILGCDARFRFSQAMHHLCLTVIDIVTRSARTDSQQWLRFAGKPEILSTAKPGYEPGSTFALHWQGLGQFQLAGKS